MEHSSSPFAARPDANHDLGTLELWVLLLVDPVRIDLVIVIINQSSFPVAMDL